MHAFIIEDDYLIGQAVRDMLERLGFTTFGFARSEDAAVAGARGRKINLITADVRLSPGDGLRAVEAISSRQLIPVLFITAFDEELKDRAPSATVVLKPIKFEALAAAVTKVLANEREGSSRTERTRH